MTDSPQSERTRTRCGGDIMCLDHARTLPGWMSDTELRWLHDTARGRSLVIEFGAWAGRSTVALASANRVLAVDTWRGSPEHTDQIAGGFDPLTHWVAATARYPNVSSRVCDLADPRDVSSLVTHYAGTAAMVFVDAAHDYESVCRDIVTAKRLLALGGLLCGHDFDPSWPDVQRAVRDSLPSYSVMPGTSIWCEP